MDMTEQADVLPPSSVATLGDPIGLGRTAEVFAFGDDGVIKLLRPGFPESLGESEAEIAARVAGAGVSAPLFRGTLRIERQFGLIYERLAGPSMLDRLARRPWEIDRLARRFAELHGAMHDVSGSGLPDQKADLRRAIDRVPAYLPDGARGAALARLNALPGGTSVCHGDMHPGNVLLTDGGAVVIDWLTASCGSPEADVARTLFLLWDSGLPGYMPRAQQSLMALARRRFGSVYLRRYRRLRALDSAQVAAWRFPIVAARLAEEVESEREALLAIIRREVGTATG